MTIPEFRQIEAAAKQNFPNSWDCSSPDYAASYDAYRGVAEAYFELSNDDQAAVGNEGIEAHEALRQSCDLQSVVEYLARLTSNPDAFRESALTDACCI